MVVEKILCKESKRHVRWSKPRLEIATEYAADDMAYTMYGVANACKIVSLLGDAPADIKRMSLLDFGCGTGVVARCLALMFGVVVAYDSSKECIEEAHLEHARVVKLTKSVTYTNKLEEAMLAQYDVAICVNTLWQVPSVDEKKIVDNMYGSLKSGGRLVVWLRPSVNVYAAKFFGIEGNSSWVAISVKRKA